MGQINPFEFVQLKKELAIVDNNQRGQNKRLMVTEFEDFLRFRVENDEDIDAFEQIPSQEPMQVDAIGQDNMYDNMSMNSDANFSVEQMSQNQGLEISSPADKYEIQSAISSFVSAGDGIFQEASFLVMDTDNSLSSMESLKNEMNIRRTMARLRKVGDGSNQGSVTGKHPTR